MNALIEEQILNLWSAFPPRLTVKGLLLDLHFKAAWHMHMILILKRACTSHGFAAVWFFKTAISALPMQNRLWGKPLQPTHSKQSAKDIRSIPRQAFQVCQEILNYFKAQPVLDWLLLKAIFNLSKSPFELNNSLAKPWMVQRAWSKYSLYPYTMLMPLHSLSVLKLVSFKAV